MQKCEHVCTQVALSCRVEVLCSVVGRSAVYVSSPCCNIQSYLNRMVTRAILIMIVLGCGFWALVIHQDVQSRGAPPVTGTLFVPESLHGMTPCSRDAFAVRMCDRESSTQGFRHSFKGLVVLSALQTSQRTADASISLHSERVSC